MSKMCEQGYNHQDVMDLEIKAEGLEQLNKDMADQLLIANCNLVTMTNKFNAAKAVINEIPGDIDGALFQAYHNYLEVCNES